MLCHGIIISGNSDLTLPRLVASSVTVQYEDGTEQKLNTKEMTENDLYKMDHYTDYEAYPDTEIDEAWLTGITGTGDFVLKYANKEYIIEHLVGKDNYIAIMENQCDDDELLVLIREDVDTLFNLHSYLLSMGRIVTGYVGVVRDEN